MRNSFVAVPPYDFVAVPLDDNDSPSPLRGLSIERVEFAAALYRRVATRHKNLWTGLLPSFRLRMRMIRTGQGLVARPLTGRLELASHFPSPAQQVAYEQVFEPFFDITLVLSSVTRTLEYQMKVLVPPKERIGALFSGDRHNPVALQKITQGPRRDALEHDRSHQLALQSATRTSPSR
jgi:hypothetical protein